MPKGRIPKIQPNEVYGIILREYRKSGLIPTLREIGEELDVSQSGVHRMVDILIREGKLVRMGDGKARALQIVNPDDDVEIPQKKEASVVDMPTTWGALVLHDDGYEVLEIEVKTRRRKAYHQNQLPGHLFNIYRGLGYPVADHRQGVRVTPSRKVDDA